MYIMSTSASVRLPSLALLLLLAPACPDDDPSAPIEIAAAPPSGATRNDGGAGGAEVVDETFDQLYPVFLLRKLAPGPKANLWHTRYQGKWIRWTGVLVSITANGATFRQIPATVTFDVSLMLDPGTRAKLRRYPPGTRITYVGRLEHFDDVFRTFYLDHGAIAEK